MFVIIKNDFLNIQIDQMGAEIRSIQSISDNHEYLWQGSENSWKRSSPILFPIIGGLDQDRYLYDGKLYELTSHGFARDRVFEILRQNNDEILFSIGETEESLKIFPFAFQLIIGYKLERNKLIINYSVVNKNKKTMLFSIGAHPGFNCPLEKELTYSDYKLVFEQNEYSDRRYKVDNVLSGKRDSFLSDEKEIPLNHKLFQNGALLFDDLKSDSISLESKKGKRKVLMNFKGFPYFGIWSWGETPADFVCLEPWFGIDSTKGDDPEWEKKEGLISLKAGQNFEASYYLEIE
jgi:galactose mutarotase-like enzyme